MIRMKYLSAITSDHMNNIITTRECDKWAEFLGDDENSNRLQFSPSASFKITVFRNKQNYLTINGFHKSTLSEMLFSNITEN